MFWVDEFMESASPGYMDQKARHHREYREEEARRSKRRQLNQELEDAKWILEYERNLAKLQEQVAEEVDRTADAGRSPKRLQKLQSHLYGVRSSITLD
jgi:hypothetical protein